MRRTTAFAVAVVDLSAIHVGGISAQDQPHQEKPAAHKMDMTMDDAHFGHMMAKHHQGGIEMAQLEEKAGASAEMKQLAAKIRKGQQSELPQLQAHGKRHKADPKMAEHEKHMQKEHAATVAKLKSARGAALDKLFAEEMIKHHEEGLMMIEHTRFKDAELKGLADKMAANQKSEIEALRNALNRVTR